MLNLGTTPTGKEGRDAVHIAIIPMKAPITLIPGEYIGFNKDMELIPLPKDSFEAIGIVDPFIRKKLIPKGDYFWLCLFPNTITNLRHVWEHPYFEALKENNAPEVKKAKDWIHDYIDENFYDISYDQFIRLIDKDAIFLSSGRECTQMADIDNAKELFENLSIVLKKEINEDYFLKGGGFSCSC